MAVRGSVEIFEFVERHGLQAEVVSKEKLEALFTHNKENAVKFLIKNIETAGSNDDEERGPLHPDNVVGLLGEYNQYLYLHELFISGKRSQLIENHYNLLATRYIENEPSLLMNFLNKTTKLNNLAKLNLKDIWKKIRDNDNFIEEEIYLRERMGFRDEALDLIVRKLRSIKRAVQFCTRTDENGDLFKKLINLVLEQTKEVKNDRAAEYVEVPIKASTTFEGLLNTLKDLYDVTEEDIKKSHPHIDLTKLKDPKRKGELVGSSLQIPIDELSDLLKYVAEPPEDIESRPASSYLDPKLLLMNIPEYHKIPQIGEKMSKIIKGSQVQQTLLAALNKVLLRDGLNGQNELERRERRAIEIDIATHCLACGRKLSDIERDVDVVIFGCPSAHVFHCTCYLGVLRRDQERGKLPEDLFVPTSTELSKRKKGDKPQENPMLIFTRPDMFAKPAAMDAFPSCVCNIGR